MIAESSLPGAKPRSTSAPSDSRSQRSNGVEKPELRAPHQLGRDDPRQRPPVQPLAREAADAQARRDALDEAHQLDVEERHALLEAVRHRHLVAVDEQPVGQEEVGVEIERLLERVAVGDVGEDALGQRAALDGGLLAGAAGQRDPLRGGGDLEDLQQAVDRVRVAEQAGGALGALVAREYVGGRAQRPRQHVRRGGREAQDRGGLMTPVAAERLVGALAGEHDLDRLGGELAQLQQGGGGGDAAGLLQAGDAVAQLRAEVRRGHRHAACRVPIAAADCAAAARSSSASSCPGKPIVKVLGGAPSTRAIAAAIPAESIPPLRKQP